MDGNYLYPGSQGKTFYISAVDQKHVQYYEALAYGKYGFKRSRPVKELITFKLAELSKTSKFEIVYQRVDDNTSKLVEPKVYECVSSMFK